MDPVVSHTGRGGRRVLGLPLPSWGSFPALALVALGLTQPVGFLLGYQPLEAFGFASMTSPLPRVFTDRAGMEDFALTYRLSIRTKSGRREERDLRAADLQRLDGPFARRAAYSAAIGYAPRLPDSLWQNALHHGFCETPTLGDALGLTDAPVHIKLTLTAKTRGRPKQWTVSVRCAP